MTTSSRATRAVKYSYRRVASWRLSLKSRITPKHYIISKLRPLTCAVVVFCFLANHQQCGKLYMYSYLFIQGKNITEEPAISPAKSSPETSRPVIVNMEGTRPRVVFLTNPVLNARVVTTTPPRHTRCHLLSRHLLNHSQGSLRTPIFSILSQKSRFSDSIDSLGRIQNQS
ncbi:hypothetical protein J6590_048522 [Homalodisca vitripennis]|nr:hypothetical protein J6590_048522 [Homalodisca vitripennis]